MSFICEVFPPEAGMVSTVSARACAVASTDDAAFLEILRPEVALAVWLRPEPVGWRRITAPLLAAAPFRAACENTPDVAVDGVLAALGHPVPVALAADMARLASIFAAITGHKAVRVRLDGVTHDACRRFHMDAIGLRLLCTYRGEGTQWTMCGPDCRAPHQAPVCSVALLKGTRHEPAPPQGCLHRSPPVSRLPENRRARILLCIDEPGVFA